MKESFVVCGKEQNKNLYWLYWTNGNINKNNQLECYYFRDDKIIQIALTNYKIMGNNNE